MNIGINLLYLLPGIVGGTETYASGLLKGLSETDSANDYYVFVNKEAADWPLPNGNFKRIVCNVRGSNVYSRYLFEQFSLPGVIKRHRIDILHSLGYVGPFFPGIRNLVTIHDMNTIGHGKNMPLHRKLLLGIMVRLTARRTDHIISVSQFSKDEIMKYLGTEDGKITVVHEAAEIRENDFPPDHTIMERLPQGKYITAFSSQSHHKNLLALIRAFKNVAEIFPHNLVLIGHTPSDSLIHKEIKDSILEKRIHFTGYVNDASKTMILEKADLFVFPSLYEGFGLPLLEAQASGVCVCSSNAGSLPEIGGESACYFDGRSVTDITKAIFSLLNDENMKKKLINLGFENVKRFSWQKAAGETKQIYEHLIKTQRCN